MVDVDPTDAGDARVDRPAGIRIDEDSAGHRAAVRRVLIGGVEVAREDVVPGGAAVARTGGSGAVGPGRAEDARRGAGTVPFVTGDALPVGHHVDPVQ